MIEEETLRLAKIAANGLWHRFFDDCPGMHPYIQSIGVGGDENGAIIRVFLVRKVMPHEKQVPPEWQGFPVTTDVIGRVEIRG